jgi:hypothetical protein
MNIIEATKEALKENKAITNPDLKETDLALVPTNSMPLGYVFVSSESKKTARRYWNPQADDLLREDWELL